MKIRNDIFIPEEYACNETLFHVANGYLGMRANFEEGVSEDVRSVRGSYINGFFDSSPIVYEERLHGFATTQQSIINIIDTQSISLILDGEPFSCLEGTLTGFKQILDLDEGIYTRSLIWTSPRGNKTEITFKRLASFALPQLVLIHLEVKPLNWSGKVTLISSQRGDVRQDSDPNDPRKAAHGRKMLEITQASQEGSVMLMQAKTLRSGLRLASAVSHSWQGGFGQEIRVSGEVNETVLVAPAKEGEALSLTKYCVFTESRRFAEPATQALALLDQAVSQPFIYWAQKQREFLKAFWEKSGVEVDGDERLNDSLAYSMYTLLASAGKDGIGNIASKGLSGEGYEGHYFWDTEIYMFPFFLLTDQGLARQLLLSRAMMLPEAKEHAREMGHTTGALYAWRTITGSECSAYFPSGSAQYHINGAIAHAFLSYWQVSGDLPFMAETGAEVLIETARLWLDAGHWYDGQFRIDSVTGPDEYSCIVNNNYYTNRSAKAHLEGLVQLCANLKDEGLLECVRQKTGISDEELTSCAKAAEAMYLPFDEPLGISAQDDAFLKKERLNLREIPMKNFPLLMHYHPLFLYRHQVCKQADTVLSHFLYEEGEKEEVIERSYTYYEGLTTHDSSLSECVFSMMAARVGDAKKAYAYYRRSAALDLENTHGNTVDGIHAANMGGCWMGIVFGFGGLRLHREGLSLQPMLPDEIMGYSFHITWQKTKLVISVTPKEVEILSEGPEIGVQLYGTMHRLSGRLCIPLQ